VIQPDSSRTWDPGGDSLEPKPNAYICSLLVAASTNRDDGNAEDRESRTELDTHANMPVVG